MTLFILAMAVTVVLLLIGVPVAFAFGVGALLFSYITGSNISFFLLPHGYNTVASFFSLLALPLFIFSGFVMAASGISERILNFINAFVGRIKGGFGGQSL
ncbi:TRAP transporter large permease subunit [Vibrio sinaloensis]|nr:TRAP transporter large permease subunit [Vibrio sinaloensis]